MHWSAEEFVLVITAFLLLAIVASSLLPGVELTPMSRATFAIGAAAFIGSAVLLARIEDVRYAALVWVVPVVPAIILAVRIRDAVSRRSRDLPPTASAAHVERTPALVAPVDHGDAHDEAPQAALRARAANPSASPQELASIAYSHPEVHATIAGNPAAPANLLEWLAAVGDTAVHAAISAREPGMLPGRITA